VRGSRGQASTEVILVAAVLAVVGMALLGAIRLSGPRPASALAAGTVAQAPIGVALPLELGILPLGDGTASVAIAARLLALGISETGTNSGPWIATFTDGNAEAWCADFVSYVLRLAGQPFTGGQSGGWRLAGAAGVRAWFTARGRYRPRAVAQPLPGDIVYFRHSHVGIVVAARGASLLTIEGNASDAVRQRLYPSWRLIADIDGFGRPSASGDLRLPSRE
jgi:hypothetical protein